MHTLMPIVLAAVPGNGGFLSLSGAVQVLIASLPLVALMLLAVLTFFGMLWDYKKNKVLIEKGGTPAPRDLNEKLLLIGIVSLFVGLGLLLFFAVTSDSRSSLLGGIIPTTAGMGIITYYIIENRKKK